MTKAKDPSAFIGGGPPIGRSPDLARILALPRRPPFEDDTPRAEALIALMTERYSRGVPSGACSCVKIDVDVARGLRACITRLNLTQAWTLYEIGTCAGAVGMCGVGSGKTSLGILAPLAMPGCRTALLLLPSTTLGQLHHEYRLLREHFRVPSLVVHGTDHPPQESPGAPTLHALAYSRLSLKDSSTWIDRLRPDTIICDEGDLISNPDCARTGRVFRFFRDHCDARFCAWTGSITDSSLKDYAHLAALALRAGSPVPIDPETVEEWCRAIDPNDWPAPAGALEALYDVETETLEDGFHRRLAWTPGVIITSAPDVGVELRITERAAPPIPADIGGALSTLREEWIRPDGEELIDALTVSRVARELAQGFYYYWHFPRGERREVIDEWKQARKEWRREVRLKLKDREPNLDSEHLVEMAAMRAYGEARSDPHLPEWRARCWPRWRAAKPTVVYESRFTRMNDYLARDAATWAREHRGIVWYDLRAFGLWVAELSGFALHAGGANAERAILKETGERSIVASIRSHGRGRNGLQRRYHEQLIPNMPASARGCEQLFGRLVRPEQRSEVVTAEFYLHTPELRAQHEQAVRRAKYVRGTIGASQKLLRGIGE